MKIIPNITFGSYENVKLIDDMCEWCDYNIGKGMWTYETPKTFKGLQKINWTISSSMLYETTTFSFRHEKDYTWFLLRWT